MARPFFLLYLDGENPAPSKYERKQVDIRILISKKQALQILHLKHHAYYYYLTLTRQLTYHITSQPS